MKSFISSILCLLCSMYIIASAQSGSCGNNATWTLDSNTGTLTINGTGEITNYSNGTDVAPWKSYSYSIKSIAISEGITSIGQFAFYGCTNATSLSIPTTVSIINQSAFSSCSALKEVKFPDGLKYIGSNAFAGCSALEDIQIPNSVEDIGSYAFRYTAWMDNQPDGAVYIGKYLITYKGDVPNGHLDIKEGTEVIAGGAFSVNSSLTSVSLPQSLICIGDLAFNHCSGLTNFDIPSSVTRIGYSAFANCVELKSISLGQGIQNIGKLAFLNCQKLERIEIPTSLKYIGSEAFRYCSSLKEAKISDLRHWCTVQLEGHYSSPTAYTNNLILNGEPIVDVVIPTDITEIGDFTFCHLPSLKSVTLHNEITRIGDYSFQNCTNIESIEITYAVTYIGQRAFGNCSSLKEITIPASVNIIESDAFYECMALAVVNIEDLSAWCNITFKSPSSNPNSVGYKHYLKLNGELLERFEIPDGITELKNYAFYKAESIISITIPASVKKIGQNAFYDCSNMLRFTSQRTTPPTIADKTFNTYTKTILYVPQGYKNKYQKATYWKNFEYIGEVDFSSIEDTYIDNLPIEYYNLQGVKVYNPLNGIFIKKQGSHTTKVKL